MQERDEEEMNKSISEQAYLVGKADDTLSKAEKALEAAGFPLKDYDDVIYQLRALCDLKIAQLRSE